VSLVFKDPKTGKVLSIEDIGSRGKGSGTQNKSIGNRAINFLTSFANAVSQGVTFGTADEIAGFFAPVFGGDREAVRDAMRDNLEQFREDSPFIAYGTEIAASVATPLGALKVAPKLAAGATRLVGQGLARLNPALATPIGKAAIGGAVYGAGSAEGTLGERLPEALKGGALGAGFGLAGKALVPVASAAAKQLEKSGIPTTVGQTFGGTMKRAEDILQSIPLVGGGVISRRKDALEAFPIYMYNKALEPVGIELPKALAPRGAFKEARTQFKKKYDEALEGVKIEISDEFLNDISSSISNAKSILGQEFKDVGSDLETQVLNQITDAYNKDGGLTGDYLKKIQKFINAKMTEAVRKGNDTVVNAYGELDSAIMDNFIKFSPIKKAQLDAVNKSYSNFIPLRKAAAKQDDSLFTPASALQAVRSEERKLGAVGEGRLAAGEGRMQEAIEAAKEVIGTNMPDSGTAGRLAGINAFEAMALGGAGLATGAGYVPIQEAMLALGGGLLGRGAYTRPAQKFIKGAIPVVGRTISSPAVAGLTANKIPEGTLGGLLSSAQAEPMDRDALMQGLLQDNTNTIPRFVVRPEGSAYLPTDY